MKVSTDVKVSDGYATCGSVQRNSSALKRARAISGRRPYYFGRNPAPPKNPWNDDSPVNPNKQWLPIISKWCETDFEDPSTVWASHWQISQAYPGASPLEVFSASQLAASSASGPSRSNFKSDRDVQCCITSLRRVFGIVAIASVPCCCLLILPISSIQGHQERVFRNY